MKALFSIAAGLILLLLAAAAPALEKASAQASRQRRTSTLEQVTTKPLILFNMRQRQDPFMAYSLVTTTASTEFFTIASLAFSGLIEMEGAQVALFRDNQDRTYTLKGSILYGPENKPLTGIRGRVTEDKKVLLEQGERRLLYSSSSTSKRLDNGRSR